VKNVTPENILTKFLISIKLHWRLYFCLIFVVGSKFLTESIDRNYDGDLIALIVFIIYSAIIYLFFGGYTQHYDDKD
jgi:hypothetical protein